MGLSNLMTRLLRPRAQVKTSRAGPMIAWSHVGQPQWTPRRMSNLAEEGFRKNVIAYRCVMQIATAAAAVPWIAYDQHGNELDTHPILDLITHPNPTQDGTTLIESVYADLQIFGNAYIEAIRPDDDGEPVELYALRPDRMKVIPGAAGLPQGYQYNVNGQVTNWSADPISGDCDILHLKQFHPLDDWYGLAPMEAALQSIDQHNASGAWNQALLNQGARPSGALVYNPKDGGPATLSDDQMQRLREEMGQLYQGDRNAGRPLILEGGLDWREMSLSPKDMDWLSGRNNAARDIALAFGVPAQLIGLPESQTYANFEQARLAFYEETVLPQITRVIAGIDHWLCPMYADRPELDFDPDSISALTDKRQAQWNKIQNATFLTRNERREAAGYGPVPGGDATNDGGTDSDDDLAKFNPYHDELGRFTTGPGGGADDVADQPDTTPTPSVTDRIGNVLQNLFGVGSAEAAEIPPDSTAPASWGNPDTLNRHFLDHGDDFGATSPQDYADQANQFYQRYQAEDLPAVSYPKGGKTAVYDPVSNTFGLYNPDGTTTTFYKPIDGQSYYDKLVNTQTGRGGQVINPLPPSEGGGGGGGLGPHIGRPDLNLNPIDELDE